MDRKSIYAIVLITLILISYPYYIEWISPPPPTHEILPDSSSAQRQDEPIEKIAPSSSEAPQETKIEAAEPGEQIIQVSSGIVQDSVRQEISLESPLVSAVLTNFNGGELLSWKLLEYEGPDGGPVEMIGNNALKVEFNDWSGDYIDLSKYNFFVESNTHTDQTQTIKMYLPYKGGRIEKIFTFNKRSFDLKMTVVFSGLEENFIGKYYTLTWYNGLPIAEHSHQEDASYSSSLVRIAGDLEIYNDAEDDPINVEGNQIQWGASRIKYFTSAVAPLNQDKVSSVKLFGNMTKIGETDYGRYSYSMNIRHPQMASVDTFLVYLGPLNYDILEDYGVDLEDMVLGSSGYERFFRPFSLAMLWILKQLHSVIPNYGVAIIVFSILLKLVLYPFTKTSYKSMKAMQKLQPEMAALKEKYKNDTQTMQKKTMELYKEHKVNPMGGCLPMLLQMPVLFSMYILFRSTVQIRGEAFFGWITDLSRPDTILALPFSIPFYGDQVSILPILMAVTMFFQQKQSITDQTQKFMIYFFPIMMLLIFNQFPSGLNLYYTLFNLLTIAQQHLIKINEADYKLVPAKEKPELAFKKKKKK